MEAKGTGKALVEVFELFRGNLAILKRLESIQERRGTSRTRTGRRSGSRRGCGRARSSSSAGWCGVRGPRSELNGTVRAQPFHSFPFLQTLILEVVRVVVSGQKVEVNRVGHIIQGTVREQLVDLGKPASEGDLGEQGFQNRTIRAFAEGKQELGALSGQGELDMVGPFVALGDKQETAQALAPGFAITLHKRGVIIHAIKGVFRRCGIQNIQNGLEKLRATTQKGGILCGEHRNLTLQQGIG